MIALTQEKRQKRINWLNARISSMEEARDEMPFGLSEDEEMELAAYKDSLASLTAEPVSFTSKANLETLAKEGSGTLEFMTSNASIYRSPIPLFTAPPVPEIKFPGRKELPDWVMDDDGFFTWYEAEIKRLNGLGE